MYLASALEDRVIRLAIDDVSMQEYAIHDSQHIGLPLQPGLPKGQSIQLHHEFGVRVVIAEQVIKATLGLRYDQFLEPRDRCGNRLVERAKCAPFEVKDVSSENHRVRSTRCFTEQRLQ